MKSLIKKIAVLVFVLALVVSTSSTVLANSKGNDDPGPGWDPPWGNKPGE